MRWLVHTKNKLSDDKTCTLERKTTFYNDAFLDDDARRQVFGQCFHQYTTTGFDLEDLPWQLATEDMDGNCNVAPDGVSYEESDLRNNEFYRYWLCLKDPHNKQDRYGRFCIKQSIMDTHLGEVYRDHDVLMDSVVIGTERRSYFLKENKGSIWKRTGYNNYYYCRHDGKKDEGIFEDGFQVHDKGRMCNKKEEHTVYPRVPPPSDYPEAMLDSCYPCPLVKDTCSGDNCDDFCSKAGQKDFDKLLYTDMNERDYVQKFSRTKVTDDSASAQTARRKYDANIATIELQFERHKQFCKREKASGVGKAKESFWETWKSSETEVLLDKTKFKDTSPLDYRNIQECKKNVANMRGKIKDTPGFEIVCKAMVNIVKVKDDEEVVYRNTLFTTNILPFKKIETNFDSLKRMVDMTLLYARSDVKTAIWNYDLKQRVSVHIPGMVKVPKSGTTDDVKSWLKAFDTALGIATQMVNQKHVSTAETNAGELAQVAIKVAGYGLAGLTGGVSALAATTLKGAASAFSAYRNIKRIRRDDIRHELLQVLAMLSNGDVQSPMKRYHAIDVITRNIQYTDVSVLKQRDELKRGPDTLWRMMLSELSNVYMKFRLQDKTEQDKMMNICSYYRDATASLWNSGKELLSGNVLVELMGEAFHVNDYTSGMMVTSTDEIVASTDEIVASTDDTEIQDPVHQEPAHQGPGT